jgi:hypothetical protein
MQFKTYKTLNQKLYIFGQTALGLQARGRVPLYKTAFDCLQKFEFAYQFA